MNFQTIFDGIFYVCSAIFKAFYIFWVPKTWRAKNVENEIVLITGAGSGLGRLLALAFAERGAEVVTCDVCQVNNDETCRLIREAGGSAHGYVCDVSERKSVYATALKIGMEVGKVTILVNNAGILAGQDFLDLSDEQIERTFSVNAMGPMWMCKAFLPGMIDSNHGHIVNIASMGGLFGSPKQTDYTATKHALVGFDESLKMELHIAGYRGVRTTLACPCYFNSGLYSGLKSNAFQAEMTSDFVAKQIMNAILANEEQVYIPSVNSFLVPLKHMFPIQAVIRFMEVVGIISGMENFRGARNIHAKK